MRIARTLKVLELCWETRHERAIQTQRTSTIPWLHLKIMLFVNPDESLAKWKAREDTIEDAKKLNTPKNEDQEWISGRWKPSSRTWNISPSSSAWQEWNSNKTRECSDWQPPADWSTSDETRERSDCQLPAEWNSSETRERSRRRSSGSWQSPFSW